MSITENPTTTAPTAPADPTDELAEQVLASVRGAMEVQAMYLGDRLGWYRALADAGPLTSAELAAATGSDERYAREWLEHQAVCGYLTVDRTDAAPGERRYTLPAAHAPVLTDVDSLAHVLPLATFVAALGKQIDELAHAYRTGGGVGWDDHGDGARLGQAAANRPLYLHQLGQELLPAAPDVHARLRAATRVADVGAGGGWSSIALARTYPQLHVDAYDVDPPSVALARANVAEAGLADRVTVHLADVGELDPAEPGRYDAAFAFECVHDLPDPVAVLTAMRRMVGDDGLVVVMDENVEERFTAPAGPVEQMFYGFSLMCCLADGMAHPHSVGTGTVMRPATLARYARRAGFGGVTILPIENDFFRFYRLDPAA